MKYLTKPKIIKINKTNKVIIKLLFYCDYNKKNIVKSELLRRILLVSNNKYKNPTDLFKKIQDLSIIDYNISFKATINKIIIDFSMVLPKNNIIENYNLEECIKLLHDNIFNPNIDKNEFELKRYNKEKEYLYNYNVNFPSNISDVLSLESCNMINEIENIYITNDEYLKILNELTSKELYNFYRKIIKNNNYITYIYGNITNEEEIFNKYFKQNKEYIEINNKFYKPLKFVEFKRKEVQTNYNQTILKLVYQIKKIKPKDKDIFTMLYFFLYSRENDLIFDNLRNKNKLIYSSNVSLIFDRSYLNISIYLDKKDIEKSKKIINETINNIKIESNFNIYKERLLKALKYDVLEMEDNNYKRINRILSKQINNEDSLDKKYKMIDNISFKDMCDLIERLYLTRELIILGGNND